MKDFREEYSVVAEEENYVDGDKSANSEVINDNVDHTQNKLQRLYYGPGKRGGISSERGVGSVPQEFNDQSIRIFPSFKSFMHLLRWRKEETIPLVGPRSRMVMAQKPLNQMVQCQTCEKTFDRIKAASRFYGSGSAVIDESTMSSDTCSIHLNSQDGTSGTSDDTPSGIVSSTTSDQLHEAMVDTMFENNVKPRSCISEMGVDDLDDDGLNAVDVRTLHGDADIRSVKGDPVELIERDGKNCPHSSCNLLKENQMDYEVTVCQNYYPISHSRGFGVGVDPSTSGVKLVWIVGLFIGIISLNLSKCLGGEQLYWVLNDAMLIWVLASTVLAGHLLHSKWKQGVGLSIKVNVVLFKKYHVLISFFREYYTLRNVNFFSPYL